MVRKVLGKKKATSKRFPRRRVALRRRRNMLNPRPVFTETYKAAEWSPNQGYTLQATMDGVGQTPLYAKLYRKYRILRAHWIVVPQFTGGEQQNAAIYNAASGPTVPPGLYSVGTARLTYAINDTPGLTAPLTEQELLEDNGVRIRMMDKVIHIKNRPVPSVDVAGITGPAAQGISFRGQYLNFNTPAAIPEVPHCGVSCYVNQPVRAGDTQLDQKWDVYCKLTFQLSDPQ